jgi:hypothetical protein
MYAAFIVLSLINSSTASSFSIHVQSVPEFLADPGVVKTFLALVAVDILRKQSMEPLALRLS